VIHFEVVRGVSLGGGVEEMETTRTVLTVKLGDLFPLLSSLDGKQRVKGSCHIFFYLLLSYEEIRGVPERA